MPDASPRKRYLDLRPGVGADYPLRHDAPPSEQLPPPDLSAYRPIDAYATPRRFRYNPFSEYDRTVDGLPADIALLPPHLRLQMRPSDRRGRA